MCIRDRPTLGALILPPVQRALRDLTDAPQLDVTIDELMPIVAGLEQGRICLLYTSRCV